MPSSAYWLSLKVQFCTVLPAFALVTPEVPGVRTLLASPHPWVLGKGIACFFLPFWSCCTAPGLEKQ